MEANAQKVIEKLKVSFPDGPKRGEQGGWQVPPLDVLDCVLSLNRNYDLFCLPRVEQFQRKHPEVDTLQRLLDLIRSYPNPLEFSNRELNYRHEARAVILVQVVEFLIRVQARFAGSSEGERLREWAITVQPADYKTLGIRGFGLAGFQYMRILFGAQTVKPDVHICRFVSEAVGRSVEDLEALTLLEIASKHLDWPLGDLDYAVWDKLARPSRLSDFEEQKAKWDNFIHQREEPQPEEDESFKDQYYISSKGEVIKEEFLKSGMFKGEFYNPEINGPDELVEESKPTLKIAAHYKLERVVSYLRNEPHMYEERSQHCGNPILEVEWAAQQLYFDMSADEKFFMDHSWGHDSDHNYSDDLIEQTAALEKKLWETKSLPKKVADAFATAAITRIAPSTYPSRNPKFIYFLRVGHRGSELMRDHAWDKYPFDEFEPYIEKTGEANSVAVCYRLRKEYESK